MSIKSEVEKWKYSNFLSNKKNNFDKSKILNILPGITHADKSARVQVMYDQSHLTWHILQYIISS